MLAEISPEIRVSVDELAELETVVADGRAEVEARDLVALRGQTAETVLPDQPHELVRRADPCRVRTSREARRDLHRNVWLQQDWVQIRHAADHLCVQRGAAQRPRIDAP